jgi:hypothetical protein
VFPSVLVGDVAKYAELEEPVLLTGVEVKEVFAEGSWLSPGSGHSLREDGTPGQSVLALYALLGRSSDLKLPDGIFCEYVFFGHPLVFRIRIALPLDEVLQLAPSSETPARPRFAPLCILLPR